jgi:CRP-like cAMP-binding protein
MTDLQLYIQSYFNIVEDSELQKVVALFKEKEVKRGEFILESGNACNHLSFIKDGMFRIYVNTEDKEITQWISTKGYFVTDLSSLLFNSPARWNIQALSDATIYMLSKSDYNRLGDILPQWHQLEKMFIAKCFTILEDRIFAHLSMSAEERYHAFFENNKELFNQVPLQYIASMLGMSAETFSRIRKK